MHESQSPTPQHRDEHLCNSNTVHIRLRFNLIQGFCFCTASDLANDETVIHTQETRLPVFVGVGVHAAVAFHI